MANSRYEYVRLFEREEFLLPNTWIVVRIDGRGFHNQRFSAKYEFEKPNDRRALDLMNAAAAGVMRELPDLILAYGVSDEYSFVFHKDCTLFERRSSKLVSTIVSTFTGYYVHLWTQHFPSKPLSPPLPSFDGRAVMYPSEQNLRDYLSWRQVDCHINNLYNTTFWTLIQKGGMDAVAAEKELSGTFSSDKNEILFSRFGMNYNNEDAMFKKGTVLYRDFELQKSSHDITSSKFNDLSRIDKDQSPATTQPESTSFKPTSRPTNQQSSSAIPTPLSKTAAEKDRKARQRAYIATSHIDIIQDAFWEARPWILSGRAGRPKPAAVVKEADSTVESEVIVDGNAVAVNP